MAGFAAWSTPYTRCCPLVPVESQSMELPATTVGEWRRRRSLRRHKGELWTVLFLPPRIVAGWLSSVTFKVFPYLTKYWSGLHPKLGGRGADSSLSESCALAVGKSGDTGTLERVANWSPDSVATVDPCHPGHQPKERPFCRYPTTATPPDPDTHGDVPEAVVVRRDMRYSLAEVRFWTPPAACRSSKANVYCCPCCCYFLLRHPPQR